MFSIGLKILSGLTNANSLNAIPLSRISMSNQECKRRPQIVKCGETSKCGGSCNNVNYPYVKICVPDVVKNVDVKVFNLMSRINETGNIEWHQTCKCECKFGANICNNKEHWNKDKCRCECKELIDKGVCDKGFIWNPNNYECECDKACDVGEYFDYENCKCRKKLVAPLIEECTETVEEVKLAKITLTENENSYKCSFCTVYTNVGGIDAYFVHFQWYLKKDALHMTLVLKLKQQITKHINGKY